MKKLGFGGMRFPLTNPEEATSIDQSQVNQMVDYFMAKGFTYFDTAYPYHSGFSEPAFRTALVERYNRNSFILANKMPTFIVKSAEDYETILQTQLQRCGVSYFDYYLLHNLGEENYQNTCKFGGFEFVSKMKEKGIAKKIGFSFHDSAELLEKILLAHPEMEFVQLQLNYLDWNSPNIQAKQCYDIATKYKKPVIVMEPVKGGGLANIPSEAEELFKKAEPNFSNASWAIRYAASLENVMMVLSGMSNLDQMKDNVSYMEHFVPLTDKEQNIISQVTEIIHKNVAIGCTACQYCVDDCPKKINIPAFFSIYNAFMIYKTEPLHRLYYNRQSFGHSKASDCIECKQCEKHCPQHLPITNWLKQVANTLE